MKRSLSYLASLFSDVHSSKKHGPRPPNHNHHHTPSPQSSVISRPSTHSRALSGDSTSPSNYSSDDEETETSDASGLGALSAPPFPAATFSVTRRLSTQVHPIQDRGIHKTAARRVGTLSEAESFDAPPPLPPKGYAYASSDLSHGVGNAHSSATLPLRSRHGLNNNTNGKVNSGRSNPSSVASPKSNSRSDAVTNGLGQIYHNNSHNHYHHPPYSHRDLEHHYSALPLSSSPPSVPPKSRGEMNAAELLSTRDDTAYFPHHHRDHQHRSTSELGHNSHGLRTASSSSQQDHQPHYQPHHHQQGHGQHYHYQNHNSRAPGGLVIVGTASNTPIIDFASSSRPRTHPPESAKYLSRSPTSYQAPQQRAYSSPNTTSSTPAPRLRHQNHRRKGSSSETESDNIQSKVKPMISHSRSPATVNSNSNSNFNSSATGGSLERQYRLKTGLPMDDGEQRQHLDNLPGLLPEKVTVAGRAASTQPHAHIQPMPVPPKDIPQIISPAPLNHHSSKCFVQCSSCFPVLIILRWMGYIHSIYSLRLLCRCVPRGNINSTLFLGLIIKCGLAHANAYFLSICFCAFVFA